MTIHDINNTIYDILKQKMNKKLFNIDIFFLYIIYYIYHLYIDKIFFTKYIA